MRSTRIAKFMMKTFEVHPTFSDTDVGDLNEVFNHKSFLHATESQQNCIKLKSSESKYNGEFQYPWDNYFGFDLSPVLQGKRALDLGCFTGGRSVAWFERYKLQKIVGIDVKQVYIDAAKQFATVHNANAEFRMGCGETVPFEDETFDAILSFDVFEHVRSVWQTLKECYRVLKTGGKVFAVFPSYFHPIEHHLSLVTRVPGIHWIFTGETLIRAYSEILEERGENAYWYARSSPTLESWERGNTINGTTFSAFKHLISGMNWKVVSYIRKPIGSIGRNVTRHRLVPTIAKLLFPLTLVPGGQEIFLHRITCILEK